MVMDEARSRIVVGANAHQRLKHLRVALRPLPSQEATLAIEPAVVALQASWRRKPRRPIRVECGRASVPVLKCTSVMAKNTLSRREQGRTGVGSTVAARNYCGIMVT